MKRKIRLLLAVVLAMAMIMGSSVTALALEGNGSQDNPYRISTMETGDRLQTDGAFHIYVKNDTGRTIYMYSAGLDSPTEVLFTDIKSEYAEFFILRETIAADGSCNLGLSSGESSATVTIRMSAPVPPDNTPEHVHSFTWQTIYEPTPDSDGLEGEVCSCGAVRNTQSISAFGYTLQEYATPMVVNAKPGQTVEMDFGEWNSFPKSFMEKVAVKTQQNVSFGFRYNWNHVGQEIRIPAGTEVDTNFDWYGPAKMQELYGAN